MAGIGFVLRRLASAPSVGTNLRGYLHAAVVSSGPWLFTVSALVALEALARGAGDIESLRRASAIVTWAFCGSQVLSAPIVLVVIRRLADGMHARDVSEASAMLLGALALVLGLLAVAGLPLLGFVAELPLAERMLGWVAFASAGGIWLVSGFLTALRNHRAVVGAFAAGMLVAVATGHAALPVAGGTALLGGLAAGLATILFTLVACVFAEYPPALVRPFAWLAALRRYRLLALAGALLYTAPWVDKWVMWTAPGHVVVAGALRAHPAYDSATFLACLSMLPTAVLFLVWVETRFFEAYLRFYREIERQGSGARIDRAHGALVRVLGQGLRNIAVLQAAVSYLAALFAPEIVGLAGGSAEMVPIFRFAVLGGLFHALLGCVLVVLAYFDLRIDLVRIGAVFVVLQALLTALVLRLGEAWLGLGYFLAAGLTLLLASSVLAERLARLPWLTFVANNPALAPDDVGAGPVNEHLGRETA